MDNSILIDRVTRIYKASSAEIHALKGVSMEVQDGEFFGLLGPNGAGKTTLIRILATLLYPTSGRVSVAGFDPVTEDAEVRRRIGVLLADRRSVYPRLTAVENLTFFGHLYGLTGIPLARRIKDLLALVGLSDRGHSLVETYSTGMLQRLSIARALIHDPRILILDEPTSGLDPSAAADLRYLLARLNQKGHTVIFTTHHLHEADQLCHRVAIVDRGELIALGRPQDLKAQIGETVAQITIDAPVRSQADRLVTDMTTHGWYQVQGTEVGLVLRQRYKGQLVDLIRDVDGHVGEMGGRLINAELIKPTLEDVYIALTGRKVVK